MLESHEVSMIKQALDFYKNNYPVLNELDKVHLENLKEKVEDECGEDNAEES